MSTRFNEQVFFSLQGYSLTEYANLVDLSRKNGLSKCILQGLLNRVNEMDFQHALRVIVWSEGLDINGTVDRAVDLFQRPDLSLGERVSILGFCVRSPQLRRAHVDAIHRTNISDIPVRLEGVDKAEVVRMWKDAFSQYLTELREKVERP